MNVFAQSLKVSSWDECMINGVPTLSCIEIIFGNILTMSTVFIILILFIMFVYGGFQYLTSFGNAEKIKKAQSTLKYALFGFILFVSSYLILKIIDILFLGGENKIFEFNLKNP